MNSGVESLQIGRGRQPSTTHKAKQKSVHLRVTVSNRDQQDDNDDDDDDDDDESDRDTVGSLLADIATALNDALRLLRFADKRHWAGDEFAQVRALEDAIDEAKADFQELGPLLKGTFYYENDRRPESLDELRLLRGKQAHHTQTFKDWLRRGGPINPLWVNDTLHLRRQLHRAQRRAAARVFASQRADVEGTHRCLGAFEVYRRQRRLDERRQSILAKRISRYESTRDELAQAEQGEADGVKKVKKRVQSWEQPMPPIMGSLDGAAGFEVEMGTLNLQEDGSSGDDGTQDPRLSKQPQYSQRTAADDNGHDEDTDLSLEELVPVCNAVGHFERFGDRDVAFTCDFCDGFIVWEDLARMPAERIPPPAGGAGSSGSSSSDQQPNWQAQGTSLSNGEHKTVVFAPLAIANHVGPDLGEWQARILCPYCDEYQYYEAGGEDETRYTQDESGFATLREFQEHLEWYHTAVAVPSLPTAAKNCIVM